MDDIYMRIHTDTLHNLLVQIKIYTHKYMNRHTAKCNRDGHFALCWVDSAHQYLVTMPQAYELQRQQVSVKTVVVWDEDKRCLVLQRCHCLLTRPLRFVLCLRQTNLLPVEVMRSTNCTSVSRDDAKNQWVAKTRIFRGNHCSYFWPHFLRKFKELF